MVNAGFIIFFLSLNVVNNNLFSLKEEICSGATLNLCNSLGAQPTKDAIRFTLPFEDLWSVDVVRRQLGDLIVKLYTTVQPA